MRIEKPLSVEGKGAGCWGLSAGANGNWEPATGNIFSVSYFLVPVFFTV